MRGTGPIPHEAKKIAAVDDFQTGNFRTPRRKPLKQSSLIVNKVHLMKISAEITNI